MNEKYQILLVDDEALIREGVSENVKWEQYGFQLVGTCENGKDALHFIENNPVDVVLTDICMPYMDGMELCERLSADYPKIKIILLSGYDEFDYAKRAISYGVKEYLLKPVTSEELGVSLDRLRKEMDHKRKDERELSLMKTAHHRGQQLLRSDMLLGLMNGSRTEEESQKDLKELGIHLEAAVYRIGIMQIDMYAEPRKLSSEKKEDRALMAFVAYNISEEIVGKYKAGEVCQGKDQRIFFLFHSNNRLGFDDTVERVLKEIIENVNENMQLAVSVGLGSVIYKMKEISLSCEGAEEALEYRYALGSNQVLGIDTIRKEKGIADTDFLLERIRLHMKENEERKLENDFRVLEDVLREYYYDRKNIEVIFRKIAETTEDLCRLSEMDEENRKEEILQEVYAAGELEGAVTILLNYCIEIAERLEGQKNIGGKKYVILANDYIEKHYSDSSLNLNTLCAYLNISTSRFSSIFKQVTKMTFMDVLIQTRMKKAKELLENTDLKNYEIAERVGFNDPHYFSVVFKKMTGKSPTEYAKEMRKQ